MIDILRQKARLTLQLCNLLFLFGIEKHKVNHNACKTYDNNCCNNCNDPLGRKYELGLFNNVFVAVATVIGSIVIAIVEVFEVADALFCLRQLDP